MHVLQLARACISCFVKRM